MKEIDALFEANAKWADAIKAENPDFFEELSKQQSPEFLWIGCSDSRVPANQIMDLPPGGVFVHRNIANVVVHTDLNCLSVLQFAVEVLKVKHVMVVGHYGCGGVRAALLDESYGMIDNWLRHIKDVARFNAGALEGFEGEAKVDRLCELNVMEQARNVASTSIVQDAWRRGGSLTVHGWIYGLKDGKIKDLGVTYSSMDCVREQDKNLYKLG